VASVGSNWKSYKTLIDTNQQCLNKIRTLAIDRAGLNQLRQENSLLRAQLSFVKTNKNYVVAEAMGKNPEPTTNVLIINRGSDRGIKVGQPVIAEEGILVGKIIKTEKDPSWVRLLNDNQSKIAAGVLNQDRAMGVLNGEHGLSLRLTMVPQNENLIIGDEVITSGLESDTPRGLLIGQIESIQKDPYEPFQSAAIKSLVDLNKLTSLTILTD
jgi:rod shape-determining protein MreC